MNKFLSILHYRTHEDGPNYCLPVVALVHEKKQALHIIEIIFASLLKGLTVIHAEPLYMIEFLGRDVADEKIKERLDAISSCPSSAEISIQNSTGRLAVRADKLYGLDVLCCEKKTPDILEVSLPLRAVGDGGTPHACHSVEI
jgi:hypothetical protein